MTSATNPETALAALRRLAAAVPDLAREESPARREFFAGGTPSAGREAELAEVRFAEWFLLERPAASLDDVPVAALGERVEDPELEPALAALRNSRAGVFQVTEVRAGQGFWARDLFGLGEYPLDDAEASHALAEGDLVVGRIFPVGEGVWTVSRAAGCFRNEELARAVTNDAERARANRRGALRVAQHELEHMFFAPGEGADPVAAARAVLAAGGLDDAGVDAVLERLAASPYDPERWAHGPGEELGQVLDELAFDTTVDLDQARGVLLAAWPLLSGKVPSNGAAGAAGARPSSVAEAVQAFDDGRAEGRDLDGLFRELEANLGLEPDPGEDDDGTLPDFPGVVGAMVEEFLWEHQRENGPAAAARFAGLRELGRAADGIGVFENLSTEHLLGFLTVWVPESGRFQAADEARAIAAAVASFATWAVDGHQLDQLRPLAAAAAGLGDDLARVQAANAQLPADADPEDGGVYRVLRLDPGGAVGLRAPGGEPTSLRLSPEAVARHLRPGDHVRGIADPAGFLGVLRCYPPQVDALEASGE